MHDIICGLAAHVDAGKTTLSEALLFASGAIRRAGRVDKGDCFLDFDVQERQRGITIFSKQARLNWNNTPITLLDTPGHTDFSGETERVMSVMDMAVLLISALDGVQGHTKTLWKLLRARHIPTILFVNKKDQPGADRQAALANLKTHLSENVLDYPAGDGDESLALCDENALDEYMQTGVLSHQTKQILFEKEAFFPCLFGSALRGEGIKEVLDCITALSGKRQYPDTFGARIYKIGRDGQGNRLSYLKVTGGVLHTRDSLFPEEKVSQIRFYSGEKFTSAEEAHAGQICAVTGLQSTRAGMGLGFEMDGQKPMLEPVFTYKAEPEAGADKIHLLRALRQIEEEDPLMHVEWNEQARQIHVHLMGDVQLEILSRMLSDRFAMRPTFSEGGILYRETIASPAEGVGHYEPLRHYAEVHLKLEPLPRGSGMQFGSVCPEDALEKSWQRLILTHLQEKQHKGVLIGAPITDLRITLVAGRAHLKHTEGGDFRQATYRAVRQGLMKCTGVLLEPWLEMNLRLPGDCLGRALNDIAQMGGECDPAQTEGAEVFLTGRAPASLCGHYARDVVAYTRGKGGFSSVFCGYRPCPRQEEIVQQSGYDPVRDVENTPDSVFCSHGAGFAVPWNEVQNYMHIDTGLFKEQKSDAPAVPAARPIVYRGTEQEDQELMAIFERTYGKITRRAFDHTQKKPDPTPKPAEFHPQEPEFLFVDGYNLIFSWEELKGKENLESARVALTEILCNYQGVCDSKIILVFDAYRLKMNTGRTESYKNITIVYTKEGETADSYIEKATFEMDKKYRARVITSDAMEQTMTLGHGALRTSAREFRREIENANVQIRRILEMNNAARHSTPAVAQAMLDAAKK